jgi:hypothetical protein
LKLAVTVASPVNVTVVFAEVEFATVADDPLTVQPEKLYPLLGAAVIAVAAPWATVTGELVGAEIEPPVCGVTVREYVFCVKLATTLASPVNDTVVVAEVGLATVASPLTVQPEKPYPLLGTAVIAVAAPSATVTGELFGAEIEPPVCGVTVSEYVF